MSEEIVLDEVTPQKRRRELLPVWIKFFIWVFMLFGIAVPAALVAGFINYSFNLSLYGLQTDAPFSLSGLVLLALFILKFMAAFGLWTEKDWAVMIAKFDAILGIVICVVVMVAMPLISDNGFKLDLRLELIALIPYLLKLNKIQAEWGSLKLFN